MVLDVAHNPEAAAVLAANLGDSGFAPETIAVFGMLRDKNIAGVVRAMAPRITRWHLASLPGPRGTDASEIFEILSKENIKAPVSQFPTVAASDKIVVFGSFLTVADAYG